MAVNWLIDCAAFGGISGASDAATNQPQNE
jgi:hypothetical protein